MKCEGFFSISNLMAGLAGGKILAWLNVDLNKPDPAYDVRIDVQPVSMSELAAIFQESGEAFSGNRESSMTFEGRGTGKGYM